MLAFFYRAEGAPLVETLWSGGLFQEQPPQSWWKPQVAFLVLLADEVIFGLGRGKISPPNPASLWRGKDVRRNFVGFSFVADWRGGD